MISKLLPDLSCKSLTINTGGVPVYPDPDLVLAGIRLLGRDMAAIADEATGTAILEILNAETGDQQRYRLVQDMAGSARAHDRSDEMLAKIKKLKQGFLEAGVLGE